MTNAQFIANFEVLASVAFMIWFFYGPWQNFVVDTLRQNLFEMRDEIFMTASEGKIERSSREYVLFRKRLNDTIRRAHELTWIQLLAFSLSHRNVSIPESPLLVALASMPNRELAERMTALNRRATYMIAVAVIVRSPFLLLTNTIASPLLAAMRIRS